MMNFLTAKPKKKELTEKQQSFLNYLIDKGGETILCTLTITHTAKDTLNDLYKRFRKSLTQMKEGWIWRKLKRATGMEYN